MKKVIRGITACLILCGFLVASQTVYGYDAKYKYIIPTMKTQEDAEKVKAFIKGLPGIYEIDVYLEKHAVVVFFDDEELDDEKMQLRIPMKKEAGYPVERYDILYEDPEKRN